jgi:hypothetical protein
MYLNACLSDLYSHGRENLDCRVLDFDTVGLNVMIEWLVCLLCVWKVPFSNPGVDTG